jgi:KDO2-lipid IV(A) lauroyltransferase
VPKFRKRALSNLALATALHLSNKEIRKTARASLQTLLITCLEYAKLASTRSIHDIVECVNPEVASALLAEGKPPIFFCGHLANWELLFLEGTSRMPGVAIGRPIDNLPLYRWVVRIREKFGGKIITPKEALREGLRGLKQGKFLGIVGDQGMPDSGYSSLFLGRLAWTSPLPALLACRTGSPLITATIERKKNKYWIHYSDPLWPPEKGGLLGRDIDQLMRAALSHLENAIQRCPGQWLWCHNRWKQQTPGKLKRAFRHDALLIALPRIGWEPIAAQLGIFRQLYPTEFIAVYAPAESTGKIALSGAEVVYYTTPLQLFVEDYRFKLLFNYTGLPKLSHHFKQLALFTAVDLDGSEDIQQLVLRDNAP